MNFCRLGLVAVAASLLWAAGPARANPAAEAFAAGEALLAKADFQGALRAFAQAARTDRTKQEYLQHYAMVQQVVALRRDLESERDPQRWEYAGRGLHAFYTANGLYDEALSLDERMHVRLNTATTATLLAETQLAMKRNAEAAETLAGLDSTRQSPTTRALLGLALARQGKIDESRQVAASIRPAADAGPGELYSAARLSAAIGDRDEAVALLTRCFQSVPPSRQEALKDHARQTPDFASLASTEAFARALATESQVPESKCSGGSRCAGCPMRGNCPSSQGK